MKKHCILHRLHFDVFVALEKHRVKWKGGAIRHELIIATAGTKPGLCHHLLYFDTSIDITAYSCNIYSSRRFQKISSTLL